MLDQIRKNPYANLVGIVDDNTVNMEILSDFLQARQYNIAAFTNAPDFLSDIGQCHPDVILMDIKLPGMDGLEAIRRLRAMPDPVLAATPVIVITALAMPGDRDRCLNSGADEYVTKPMILRDLILTIESYVKKDA